MTSINVLSIKGEKSGTITLPDQFSEDYRPEIIKRAFKAQNSNKLQPYGASPLAGKLYTVYLRKRRRKYRSAYGKGRSRGPKKVLWRRGSQFSFVGAFAPFTVGGRRAHPPKAEKALTEKVNQKERRLAIRSALSATISKDIVSKKHDISGVKNLPIILDNDFEKSKKTKDIVSILNTLGLEKELQRVKEKKVRAGKGKMRGRKYRTKVGPLIVVAGKCALQSAAKNIPGIDIVQAKNLNIGLLAPGSHAGRLTLYTKSAVELIGKEALFK